MITLKIIFNNDDYCFTRFNGNIDDAEKYYAEHEEVKQVALMSLE